MSGSSVTLKTNPGLPAVLCKWESTPSCRVCRDTWWLCSLNCSLYHISYQRTIVCGLIFSQLHMPCASMPLSKAICMLACLGAQNAHDMRMHVSEHVSNITRGGVLLRASRTGDRNIASRCLACTSHKCYFCCWSLTSRLELLLTMNERNSSLRLQLSFIDDH